MKKNFLIVCFLVFTFGLFAQLKITGKHLTLIKDSVKVIVFDSISADTRIEYTGTNIRFYKFQDINTSIYNTTGISEPDEATGYIVEEDGLQVDTIWVIDYHNYIPIFHSLEAEDKPDDQCTNLNVIVTATIPDLKYKTPTGTIYTLPREFEFKYKTLKWDETWSTVNVDTIITFPKSLISIEAPLCDTYFSLSDQYATELELGIEPFTSPLYKAVAVKSNLISVLTTRNEINEDERPSTASQQSGSAPLEIQFLSNANEPIAKYYNWSIYKGSEMVINRSDKDHRYTFEEHGTYTVKLIVTNEYCTDSSSITITVSESKLEVPNVFTPNGDGTNDEFRVAYKSIVKFDCWVYNRWGRLVFHWTDPTKGWDGRINGKKATPGPYFYVIKAFGSDFDANSVPDKTTKKRVGEWVLKGDINLLR